LAILGQSWTTMVWLSQAKVIKQLQNKILNPCYVYSYFEYYLLETVDGVRGFCFVIVVNFDGVFIGSSFVVSDVEKFLVLAGFLVVNENLLIEKMLTVSNFKN